MKSYPNECLGLYFDVKLFFYGSRLFVSHFLDSHLLQNLTGHDVFPFLLELDLISNQVLLSPKNYMQYMQLIFLILNFCRLYT